MWFFPAGPCRLPRHRAFLFRRQRVQCRTCTVRGARLQRRAGRRLYCRFEQKRFCIFPPGAWAARILTGTISRTGLDLGATGPGQLAWGVVTEGLALAITPVRVGGRVAAPMRSLAVTAIRNVCSPCLRAEPPALTRPGNRALTFNRQAERRGTCITMVKVKLRFAL